MKSDFREEIARRKEERRNQRSNTWLNLLLRIIFFAVVIFAIQYFGKVRARKIEIMLQTQKPDTTEVFEDK